MRSTAAILALAFGAHSLGVVVYVNPPVGTGWIQPYPPPMIFADLTADGQTDFGFFLSVTNYNYNGERLYTWGATNGSGFSLAPVLAGSLVGPSVNLTGTGQTLGDWSWTREPEPPYRT